MSKQHTPEPWEVSALGGGLHANNVPICQFFDQCEDDYQNSEANARRIVACVNACAGIPNEQLECDNVEFVRIFNERNTLKQQRDELLAALERLVQWSNNHGEYVEGKPDFVDGPCVRRDIKGAIEALASVKGGAPC